ncbi:MAG: phosphoadenylyl-sulfate reductase [Acidimicrobiia bacterium]|nr:phosphoadenylyl-sulfate reductase [Acidimicrobiia bacterium]
MTIPHYYPVLFNLEGRRVVVVGGGDVATEKVEQLVPTGASLFVIAPDLSPTISNLAAGGAIHWVARRYRPGDLLGAYLVVAATNEPDTNAAVWEEAEMRSIPVNSVDDIPHCSYIVPSVHRSGPLTIAISSGGTAPTVAVRARQALAERYDEKHGEYLYLLNEYRERVKANIPTFEERRDLWYRIVDDGVEDIYRREGEEAASAHIETHITAAEDEVSVEQTLDYIRAELALAKRPAMTLGMQLGGMVLLHLLRKVRTDVPVIFVDTGYHFPETIAFRDEITREWGLDLRVASAQDSLEEHESKRGVLHLVDTISCCALRKVLPAHEALEGHDLWLSSVRRTQTAERKVFAPSQDFALETGGTIRRASPLLDWTWDAIERYAEANSIPRHPLYAAGYTSIGCAPCTSPTFGTDDDRAGRWNGERVECGLNVAVAP